MTDGGRSRSRQSDSAAASDIHVSVTDLDKTYRLPAGGAVAALRHIDLKLRRGEFVSVVGPSGCGKSTLLKCIAGITSVSGGDIRVDNEMVVQPPENMAIVFQRDILLDWRTVIENVLFPIEIKRLRKEKWMAQREICCPQWALPDTNSDIHGNCQADSGNALQFAGRSSRSLTCC